MSGADLPGGVVARLRAGGSVFAEDEARLLARSLTGDALDAAVARRVSGEPLEHVLGWADFAGVRVGVRAPVFVPRPRAEPLVEAALAWLAPTPGGTVVDLGCGCGAIAAAVARRAPTATVHACDLDPEAVACARDNGGRFGFSVHEGSWFDALPMSLRGGLDVVVAHLPYVPTRDLPLLPGDYRAAERDLAVDGGRDGLDPLRAVLRDVPGWLSPQGVLLTQVTRAQLPATRAAIAAAGLATSPGPAADAATPVVTVHTLPA